jgi:hypothetical protein
MRLGVVSWYLGSPGELSAAEVADALTSTDLATVVPLREQSEEIPRGAPDGADTHPLLRAKVQQATGMISVQLGVGLDAALSRLGACAFAAERPIDEVAEDVISHRVRFHDGHPDAPKLHPTR